MLASELLALLAGAHSVAHRANGRSRRMLPFCRYGEEACGNLEEICGDQVGCSSALQNVGFGLSLRGVAGLNQIKKVRH